MARVVKMHAVGDAAVLRVDDQHVSDPGPGEIRLRQAAAGINYVDIYHRTGLYPVPEDGRPLAEGKVGGDDDAGALIKLADEVEQQLPSRACERQISKLVEYHQVEPRQLRRQGPAFADPGLLFEACHQPGRTSYTFNLATFRGEQAAGASIAHRFNTDKPFAFTAGVSYAGSHNTAARIGVAGEF